MFSLAALGQSSKVTVVFGKWREMARGKFSFWIRRQVSESDLIDAQTATLVSCCIFSVSFLASFNSASNKLILFWTSPKTWQCLGANLQSLRQKTCPKPRSDCFGDLRRGTVPDEVLQCSWPCSLHLHPWSWSCPGCPSRPLGNVNKSNVQYNKYSRTADSCQQHPEANEQMPAAILPSPFLNLLIQYWHIYLLLYVCLSRPEQVFSHQTAVQKSSMDTDQQKWFKTF